MSQTIPCAALYVSNTKDKHVKKDPRCKFCEGKHYQTFCPNKPRKGLKRTAIKQKPIKQPTFEEQLAKAQKAAQRSLERKKLKGTTKPKKPAKRAYISAQSKSYRSTQIRKADRIFSLYIRLRYAVNFYVMCVTCGRKDHYKKMQNGHYISRRVMATRFDEINCNVQCDYCNETLHGNLKKYKEYLERTYGKSVIPMLQLKVRNTPKLQTYQIQEIIDEYTKKVDELLNKPLH